MGQRNIFATVPFFIDHGHIPTPIFPHPMRPIVQISLDLIDLDEALATAELATGGTGFASG